MMGLGLFYCIEETEVGGLYTCGSFIGFFACAV